MSSRSWKVIIVVIKQLWILNKLGYSETFYVRIALKDHKTKMAFIKWKKICNTKNTYWKVETVLNYHIANVSFL